MSGFEDVNYYFRKAARVMDLSAAVGRILVTPYREVKVDASITLDSGGVTEANVKDIRAGLILEAANAPTTPKADEALAQRGVTVSSFEWAQNIQQFTWEEDMRDADAALARVVGERKVSFRTGAFVMAIGRVGRATVLRGV